jgi:eukaryotic-like serine/threonine-protein kinase
VDDQTIDMSVGFDSTVASTHAAGPMTAPPPSATVPRSTVLPRLEMVGAEPRLVHGGQRRYEAVRRLGEGGMGEVIGVRDNDIGRDVALKRLRTDKMSPAVLARFAEEVRTVGSLEHPNIVPIHDVGVEENGDYYFVMKYVDGETLESIIDKLARGDRDTHARFGVERRVQIFMSLLEAVAFAHSKGIVHRDIKPANVMVGAYGEVVLMDWGIAKRVRGEEPLPAALPRAGAETLVSGEPQGRGALYKTRVGELIGTPAYMSPEQSRGEPIDERSDVYSLSLLFYELLTLEHPLASKTTLRDMLHAITSDAPKFAGVVSHPSQATVSIDLSWYLAKGLQKNAAARYQSVAEMIERLANRAEGNIPIQCPVTLMRRTTNIFARFIDRHWILACLFAVGSVAAMIATGAVLARAIL